VDARAISAFTAFPFCRPSGTCRFFADSDANKTGEIAAYGCQERWQRARAEVVIQMPPNVGEDIADIISNRRIY